MPQWVKSIFLLAERCISIQILLNLAPNGPIANTSLLVQIMSWCRIYDKTLAEPVSFRSPFEHFWLGKSMHKVHIIPKSAGQTVFWRLLKWGHERTENIRLIIPHFGQYQVKQIPCDNLSGDARALYRVCTVMIWLRYTMVLLKYDDAKRRRNRLSIQIYKRHPLTSCLFVLWVVRENLQFMLGLDFTSIQPAALRTSHFEGKAAIWEWSL